MASFIWLAFDWDNHRARKPQGASAAWNDAAEDAARSFFADAKAKGSKLQKLKCNYDAWDDAASKLKRGFQHISFFKKEKFNERGSYIQRAYRGPSDSG